MHGWHGRLLQVDLGTGSSRFETIPADWLHAYLGGRGLGVRLLRDFFRLDPFAPEMPLVFACGPLCGTPAPTSARLAAVSRSPLTGTIYDCSAGGRFAHRLKSAGIDALLLTGRSPQPAVLAITPQGAEVLDAPALWGKTVGETVAALSGRGSVAAIGPAGENRVLFANIMMGEGNSVGRGGLGAVMGSKNLKAIAVDGDCSTRIADPERLRAARQDVMRLFKASPIVFGQLGLAEYGTPTLVDLMRQRRMAPTENFRRTVFEAAGNYSGPAIRRTYEVKKDGCFGCPIQCKKSLPTGEHLPEYETVSHFGALNGIADLPSIVRANTLCNELGLDTISAAATLAAWGELQGRFPQAAEIGGLLQEIAARRGIGERLAEGSRRLAAAAGRPDLSMSVKSLELPAYDPRGAYGMALAYCTSNRGGCHLRAYPVAHEILRKPVPTDRFSFAGKARIIKIAEDTNAAIDSLVACKFSFFGASLEEYGAILSAVTGSEYSPQDLKDLGQRIYLTERFYNLENGFSMADDTLPERFFTESGSSGEGIDIPPIDRARFTEELRKYYRIRGLTDDGRLSRSRLPGGTAVRTQIARYAAKLAGDGSADPRRIAFLARDDVLLAQGPADLAALGEALLEHLNVVALAVAQPSLPLTDFLVRRADPRESCLVPRDTETRTFLHDIPFVRREEGRDPQRLARLLHRRKGLIVEGVGIIAGGGFTPEQAFINYCSVFHAAFVGYLTDLLQDGFRLPGEEAAFAALRQVWLRPIAAEGLPFHPGPLADREAILAEIARTGRYTVQQRLVDSSFGNISWRDERYRVHLPDRRPPRRTGGVHRSGPRRRLLHRRGDRLQRAHRPPPHLPADRRPRRAARASQAGRGHEHALRAAGGMRHRGLLAPVSAGAPHRRYADRRRRDRRRRPGR